MPGMCFSQQWESKQSEYLGPTSTRAWTRFSLSTQALSLWRCACVCVSHLGFGSCSCGQRCFCLIKYARFACVMCYPMKPFVLNWACMSAVWSACSSNTTVFEDWRCLFCSARRARGWYTFNELLALSRDACWSLVLKKTSTQASSINIALQKKRWRVHLLAKLYWWLERAIYNPRWTRSFSLCATQATKWTESLTTTSTGFSFWIADCMAGYNQEDSLMLSQHHSHSLPFA